MKNRNATRLMGLNLLLLAALLAVLAWAALGQVQWHKPVPQRPDYRTVLDGVGSPIALNAQGYDVLVQQPLFEPDRRPPVPEPPPAPPPPPEQAAAPPPPDVLDHARILGTYGSSRHGGVILHFNNEDHRLRLNQSLQGWTLQRIRGRVVTFRAADGAQRELVMEHQIPEPGAVPPGQAAPASNP